MNPLIIPTGLSFFYSLSFCSVSRHIAYDKYGAQAWLLVACSILQPLYKHVSQDVNRPYEQVTNTFNLQLARVPEPDGSCPSKGTCSNKVSRIRSTWYFFLSIYRLDLTRGILAFYFLSIYRLDLTRGILDDLQEPP